MYCPDCKSEYREGFKVCADCGAELVTELIPEEKSAEQLIPVDWQLLTTAANDMDAAFIESFLAGEDITIYKKPIGAGAYLQVALGQNLSGGVDILVPNEDLERARETLAAYRDTEIQDANEIDDGAFYGEDFRDEHRSVQPKSILPFIIIPILIVLIIYITTQLTGCAPQIDLNSHVNISTAEAYEMMNQLDNNFIILDVRSYLEFRAERIEQAISIPHNEIRQLANDKISDSNMFIFVYCQTGRRSEIAARELVNMGFPNVLDMGGIVDWQGETVSN